MMKPTQEGWYWMLPKNGPWQVVEVYRAEGILYMRGYPFSLPVDELNIIRWHVDVGASRPKPLTIPR